MSFPAADHLTRCSATGQSVLHVIKEMESKDEKKVMAALMELDY